jgi:hypothetical protein
MVLHEAMDYRTDSEKEAFPAETLTLMPLDNFETVPAADDGVSPVPFFIFSDEDEDDEDIDNKDSFDDMEEDFEDDDFEDDDFDDDDDDDYDDDDDDYDEDDDVDYDDLEE